MCVAVISLTKRETMFFSDATVQKQERTGVVNRLQAALHLVVIAVRAIIAKPRVLRSEGEQE